MRLRKLALVPIAAALVGFGPAAYAWTGSFNDMGVSYSLTDSGGSATNHSFTLVLNTTGYDHHASPSFLDSVDIKAWDKLTSFTLVSAPGGTAWNPTFGAISSGPVSNTGCGGSGAGFACVEAVTKGVLNVNSGNPYTFVFDVTAGSFLNSAGGAHVGAGYASINGTGSSYGITSVTMTSPIPEPEQYALILAGLGVLGFAVRRRKDALQEPAAA